MQCILGLMEAANTAALPDYVEHKAAMLCVCVCVSACVYCNRVNVCVCVCV